MTEPNHDIATFLAGRPHAVVGASRDPSKYGYKVWRSYLTFGRPAFAVNPRCDEIDGQPCYPDLASLPELPHGISVVTPPAVTESVVEQAAQLGIRNIWLQPGAESDRAIAIAKEHGLNIIAGGPCVMVLLPQWSDSASAE